MAKQPKPKEIQAWLLRMQGAILDYEQTLGDSWDRTEQAISDSMRDARRRMTSVLKRYPPDALNDPNKNRRLRMQLEGVYTDWALQVKKDLGLPSKDTASTNYGGFAGDVQVRARTSLDTGRAPTGATSRPLDQFLLDSAQIVNQTLTDFADEFFPGQMLTGPELAQAMADYLGIEDASMVENVSRNLADVVSKHANELSDRIRNPRPDSGAGSPEDAVHSFDMGEGKKGNLNAIRASHDAHGRALLRNTMIDAAGDDIVEFLAFDARKRTRMVLGIDEVRKRLAGNQPPVGPNSTVYPFPLPHGIVDQIEL